MVTHERAACRCREPARKTRQGPFRLPAYLHSKSSRCVPLPRAVGRMPLTICSLERAVRSGHDVQLLEGLAR